MKRKRRRRKKRRLKKEKEEEIKVMGKERRIERRGGVSERKRKELRREE